MEIALRPSVPPCQACVAAREVGRHWLPVAFRGQVALDDVMVDVPRLESSAPSPHLDFPTITLHVHARRQYERASGYGLERVGLRGGLQRVFVGALTHDLPRLPQRFAHEELHRTAVAAGEWAQRFLVLLDDAFPIALWTETAHTCTPSCRGVRVGLPASSRRIRSGP